MESGTSFYLDRHLVNLTQDQALGMLLEIAYKIAGDPELLGDLSLIRRELYGVTDTLLKARKAAIRYENADTFSYVGVPPSDTDIPDPFPKVIDLRDLLIATLLEFSRKTVKNTG